MKKGDRFIVTRNNVLGHQVSKGDIGTVVGEYPDGSRHLVVKMDNPILNIVRCTGYLRYGEVAIIGQSRVQWIAEDRSRFTIWFKSASEWLDGVIDQISNYVGGK